MSEMRFQFESAPEETRLACGAIVRVVWPKSRANAILIGMYTIVVAAALLVARATAPQTIFIGVGGILATLVLLQREAQRRFRTALAADPHVQETQFVEIAASGVRTWCEHMESRHPWSDFAKVTEDGHFYLFCRAGGAGTAIPKRILNDASDAELRRILTESVPSTILALAREIGGSPVAAI